MIYLVIGLIVLICFGVGVFSQHAWKRLRKSPEERAREDKFFSKAARVYKVAYIEPELTFHGVSGGGGYSVDSIAFGKGFHGFYNFATAQRLLPAYSQYRSAVILECVLYGDVESKDDGAIGTRQRVLQVILPDCIQCSNPAVVITPGFCGDAGWTFCKNHKSQAMSNFLDGSNRPITGHRLAQRYAEEGVVVSTESGPHKFIPTVDDNLRTSSSVDGKVAA